MKNKQQNEKEVTKGNFKGSPRSNVGTACRFEHDIETNEN